MQESLSSELSPEKLRELQRLLDRKTGDNVRNGCGKKKCPCKGEAENCHRYVNRESQAIRLKSKSLSPEIQEFFDRGFQITYSLPDGLAGAG